MNQPVISYTGCASVAYNPFLDEKISKAPVCQESLTTLVENNAFREVKTLIDLECNNIVVQGWVQGRFNSRFRKGCKAPKHYFKQRPALERVAKKFVTNACYPENPDFFYWHLLNKPL